MIKLLSLPPAYDLLPLRAVDAIRLADTVILQSGNCGPAEGIKKISKEFHTLDGLFESAEDFDALYDTGAEELLRLAEGKEAVFCVIGELYSNGFVKELMQRADVEALCDANAAGYALFIAGRYFGDIGAYCVVDARNLENAYIDTSAALVVMGIDNAYTAGEAKLKLAEYYPEGTKAVLVRGAEGMLAPLYGIDRAQDFGAGLSLVLAAVPLAEKSVFGFYDLVEVMKILRGKNGCPWDAEQTHKTLRQYLLEESYEVMDAIDKDDMAALYDELGDVLLQVAFHAEIGRQCGEFDINDVTTAICEKMMRRHPHVFGAVEADTPEKVLKNWDAIKKVEKGNETFVSVLKDIPQTMGAMMRAYKLQKKAANIGFDWENAKDAFEKVKEESAEFYVELENGDADGMESEAGDLLFAVINVLRKCGVNPEVALQRTCDKFIDRFEFMETRSPGGLQGLSLAEMDLLWEKSKKNV